MDLQGRDLKKSRNLMRYCAVFADGLILAFCEISGWGCGQRGRCPSHLVWVLKKGVETGFCNSNCLRRLCGIIYAKFAEIIHAFHSSA